MTWIRETITPVSAGDWAFELRDDEISVIRFRGADVLRSVRAVARDRDWATPQWTIAGVAHDDDSVRIDLRTTELGSDLAATLTATAVGPTLTVAFEATSAVDFLTNRTGLVVLHPPQLAGAEMVIGHSDGTSERTSFPVAVSPHQPAFDIGSLGWEHDGVRVTCAFDGDVFEMEDQRNWTDASYKTYSRPLALPFPYPLAAGETVRQSVTVTAEVGMATPSDPAGAGDAEPLRFGEAVTMPTVSVGASTAPDPGPGTEPLGADLLIELDLGWRGWPAALERAAQGGLPLDVRLVLPESGAAEALAEACRDLVGRRVARIAVFQPAGHEAQHVSDAEAVSLLRTAMADAGLRLPVIGGARSHFTELNREHGRLPRDLDGIAFSVTPMFHAFETLQLEESISMQRVVAEQAVRIAAGAPVHVGPVTLRTHVNNVATTAPPRPSADDLSEGYGPELLDADDARQAESELAAWVIASAAALSVPGVGTLSYFEEWGPRGVRSAAGDDLPSAAALRALALLAGSPVRTARSADGRVWAIRSEKAALVASLAPERRTVTLDGREVTLEPRAWLLL